MIYQLKFTSEAAAAMYDGHVTYGSEAAAGFDLRACISEPVTILPGEQMTIPTGIALQRINDGVSFHSYAGIVLPRSGRGSRDGLVLGNAAGVIDDDYQGEIILCVWARPTNSYVNVESRRVGGNILHIEPSERIEQYLIMPVMRPEFEVVSEFSAETKRGAGGFGSTGK